MLDMLTSIGDVVAVLIMIGIIGGIGFFIYFACTAKNISDANEREIENIERGQIHSEKDEDLRFGEFYLV